MSPKGESKELKVCPRCGLPYSYIKRKRVGDKVYLYAVHYHGYTREGGKIKKKVTECYLGPEGSYEYVTKTHLKEGLILKGMIDTERALAYLDALISYIGRASIDRETARRLGERFIRLGRKLTGLLDINEVEEILRSHPDIEYPVVKKRVNDRTWILLAPSEETARKWCEILERHGYIVEITYEEKTPGVRVSI